MPPSSRFGFGAIGEPGSDGGQSVTIIDEHLRQRLGISDIELDRIVAVQQAELSRRIQQYRNGRELPALRGRQVIVVDDGMATGLTARVAVSTGAAAAPVAAVDATPPIRAVVSRWGRPDLAGLALARVPCPTLLIVGERDELVLELNEQARAQMHGPVDLHVVPGASHLFEEFGTLDAVASLAAGWLRATLGWVSAAA
ncbi:MAG: hypothetical protein ACKOW5_07780 [Actinomycetales bacterium]